MPMSYISRLNDMTKTVICSSDDEFMTMEWTAQWFDDFATGGEQNLWIGAVEVTFGLFALSLRTGLQRDFCRVEERSSHVGARIPREHIHVFLWKKGVLMLVHAFHTKIFIRETRHVVKCVA